MVGNNYYLITFFNRDCAVGFVHERQKTKKEGIVQKFDGWNLFVSCFLQFSTGFSQQLNS